MLAGLLTFPYALLLLPGEMPGGVWQGGHVSGTLLSSCCLAPEVGRGTYVPQAGCLLSPGQDACPAGVRLPGSWGARGQVSRPPPAWELTAPQTCTEM